MKKVSDCCGQVETDRMPEELGFCPDCREHCVFIETSAYFEDGEPVVTDRNGFIKLEYDRRQVGRRASDRHVLSFLVFAFICVFAVGISAGFYVGAAYSASIVLGAK